MDFFDFFNTIVENLTNYPMSELSIRDYITLKPDDKTYLRIKVAPRQPHTEFFGILDDGTLKIRLKALPEKGRANTELVRFLAEELCIKKDRIEILMGGADTTKMVRINSV